MVELEPAVTAASIAKVKSQWSFGEGGRCVTVVKSKLSDHVLIKNRYYIISIKLEALVYIMIQLYC